MIEDHPEVEKIIVFGSFIRDEAVPGSDLDLLIILSDSQIPLMERIPRFLPSSFPIPVDVFPYTKKEVEMMLEEGNLFIKRALAEGKELA